MAEFIDQLRGKWQTTSPLCVGLDAEYSKIPPHIAKDNMAEWRQSLKGGNPNLRFEVTEDFLRDIVDATADLVCAYKPNIAFFEDSPQSLRALGKTVRYIHNRYPGIPVIGDTKRADIGNTNRNYGKLFDRYDFDAVTTNPYLGPSTYPALLEGHPGKGLIVLCKTTNPDAAVYQDAPIDVDDYAIVQKASGNPLTDEEYELAVDSQSRGEGLAYYKKAYGDKFELDHPVIPMFFMVAIRTATLAKENPNIGLVVGATHPESFAPIRALVGDTYFLIPGIGSQGGDAEATLKYAPDSQGHGMIINNGSKILFASNLRGFAQAAREEAKRNYDLFRASRAA